MKIPSLQIGELVAKVPIIQGGMGAAISRSGLASAVANEGGVGVISAVHPGFDEPDFETNNKEANIRGLKNQIIRAKELSPKGIIGVNILTVMKDYREYAKTAVEEKIDLIISGAGLPKELPEIVKGSLTKIVPIVSSGRAADLISKIWDQKGETSPDMVIVEGPEAGGHLGFSLEQLIPENKPNLEDIVKDVIQAIKPYAEKYCKNIPVIAAGGIFTGTDIAKYLKIGASGVQMGTRFIATEECDADIRFKQAFINSKIEDIQIVKSPVGLPGRAIRNKFLEGVEKGNSSIRKCYNCIKTCNPANTPYCISRALIEAVKGNVDNGLIFSGSNGYRIDKIVTAKELITELVLEAELALT